MSLQLSLVLVILFSCHLANCEDKPTGSADEVSKTVSVILDAFPAINHEKTGVNPKEDNMENLPTSYPVDKRIFRYGKRNTLFRFGKRDLDSEYSKKSTLFRFGKRDDGLNKKSTLFRFGKRDDGLNKKSTLFRFGKRGDGLSKKSTLFRFGKRGDGLSKKSTLFRFGKRADDLSKRSTLFRFGKRADDLSKRSTLFRFGKRTSRNDVDNLSEGSFPLYEGKRSLFRYGKRFGILRYGKRQYEDGDLSRDTLNPLYYPVEDIENSGQDFVFPIHLPTDLGYPENQ